MPELQSNTERPLVACSLWLHIGFIGAAALAAGLIGLFGTEATWLSVALVFSGGVLAAASWRRARTVLEPAGRLRAGAMETTSESASRASSNQARSGTMAMLSGMPLQSTGRRADDRRYPTAE